MSKKILLLALAAVSAAMFAVPAVASANSLHVDKTGKFTVHGPAGSLSTVEPGTKTVNCQTTTGDGEFTTTTTGTLNLIFHGCTTTVFGFKVSCTSTEPSQSTGTIETTPLAFHLVTIDGSNDPGILVTPASGTQYAHFSCAGVQTTVEGHGIVGTLTAPDCDGTSKTATVDFNLANGVHGKQEHRLVTNVSYGLTSGGEEAAMDTHATITFPENRTLDCT